MDPNQDDARVGANRADLDRTAGPRQGGLVSVMEVM
jgi:hypothetical protein